MLKQVFLIFLISLVTSYSYSQELIEDGERQVLTKNEYTVGIGLQSAGIAVFNFRKGVHKTVNLTNYWEVELANLQHPKEFSDSRFDYIFKPGKINTVWTLRASYGQKRELAEKFFSGVGLYWVYSGGVSLAIAKPIIVEVTDGHVHAGAAQHPNEITAYNPALHSIGNIQNKESFFTGMDAATFYPGIFFKTGLSFEYSEYKDKIRAVEIGVSADYYLKEVPIMSSISNDNANLYIAFYVNFLFGKKW